MILDVNEIGAGSAYVELGVRLVSPDDRWLAWSVDLVGDEVYRLRFRDLETGEDLAEEVPRSYYSGAWSADSRHFFYTVHDEAYRPFQVWRHELGTPVDGGRAGPRGARRALRAPGARHPQRWSGRALVAVARHQRGVGGRRRLADRHPALGGRAPAGVEYHAEHLAGAPPTATGCWW